jgi:signal transduction histidine kinase
MLNIINDISISKIESGQMNLSYKETLVKEQIESVYNSFINEAQQKNTKLTINKALSASYNMIRTDTEKLRAILSHLLANALKFTGQGSIEIGCFKNCNAITFYLEDAGIGIEGVKTDVLFEQFRQASNSLNWSYDGTYWVCIFLNHM